MAEAGDERSGPGYHGNQQQDDQGYPVGVLVNHQEKYVCALCGLLFRVPVQNPCGHRFCKRCLEAASPDTPCPSCAEEEDEDGTLCPGEMFPDPATARELGEEAGRCVSPGCEWRGRVREYRAHERQCARRTEVSRDRGRCQFGCDAADDDVHRAEFVTVHANILLDKVTSLQSTSLQSPSLQSTSLQSPSLQSPSLQSPSLQSPSLQSTSLQSPSLQTSPLPSSPSHPNRTQAFNARAGDVEARVTELQRRLEDLDMRTDIVHRPPHVQVEPAPHVQAEPLPHVQRLDDAEAMAAALNQEISVIIDATAAARDQSESNAATIASLRERISSLGQSEARRDVSLVATERRLRTLECTSTDGTLTWCVTDLARKRAEAVRGTTQSLYSPVFFTSQAGYKMCARLYLNGDGMGRGSHISLFFVIMRGDYDAVLPWPFARKVILKLVAQGDGGGQSLVESFRPDPTSSSFRRPVSEMNVASGVPLFCPLARLLDSNTHFVKDDTMFIKVVVDPDAIQE